MKTVLILLDQSDAAEALLNYASRFVKDLSFERVLLLQTCYRPIYSQIFCSVDFVQLSAEQLAEEKTHIQDELKVRAEKLQHEIGAGIKVEYIVSSLPLLRSLHQANSEFDPRLVMMGFNPDLQSGFIGSQIIELVKSSSVSVLVVPQQTSYLPIRQALVPIDFSSVSEHILVDNLKRLEALDLELKVLNVDQTDEQSKDRSEHEQRLKQLLREFDHKLYYVDHESVVKGILEFASVHQPELIIGLPGKHSFFYRLRHSSITKALTLNAYRPVLVLK